MCGVIQDQLYSMDTAEVASVRRTVSLTTAHVCQEYSRQAENYSGDDFVLAVEDDLESDRDSTPGSSPSKPLTGSKTNQGHLQTLKNAISRVSSLAGNQQLGGNTAFTANEDKGKWQGIEHYLREQNKDSDPEALTKHKKRFYQRTWFACVMYSFLLLLFIAAILAIASNRAVILPTTVLEGQILQNAAPKKAVISNVGAENDKQNLLNSDSTTLIATSNPTMDQSNNGPSLLISVDTTTVQPDVKSSSNPGPTGSTQLLSETLSPAGGKPTSTGQDLPEPVLRLLADAALRDVLPTTHIPVTESVLQQEPRSQPISWWNMLTLPGPLQRSSGSSTAS